MKVKLKSDFHDFYDIWFDSEADFVFERFTTSGLSRGAMLNFLKNSGVNVIRFGTCEEMYSLGCEDVVVYTDTHLHRGEGKVLMSASNAKMSMPNYLCSEYIGIKRGISIRHLQLGEYYFTLEYKSKDDWRSNCGYDVDIRILNAGFGYHNTIKAPIFAIDFVHSENGLLAVDYNIAPGCGWTGINELVSAKEIADSIKKTIEINLKQF